MIRRKRSIRQSRPFYTNPVIIGFFALLTTLLLFGFSQASEKQVMARYYGDFGLYTDSQVLILKKNGSFTFTYFGCSQNHGALKGRWQISADTLKLGSNTPLLRLVSPAYKVTADSLISLDGNDNLHKH
jgi:hypothetical protein